MACIPGRSLKLGSFPSVRPCVRRCRAQVEHEEKAPALIAGSGADSRDGSVGMSDCDFKIIDNDQDNPSDNHMYILQTLTSPELTRIVIGATSSEATADLHAEATRICKDEYHEVGLQTRCVAVWLHAARLQPLVLKKLRSWGLAVHACVVDGDICHFSTSPLLPRGR